MNENRCAWCGEPLPYIQIPRRFRCCRRGCSGAFRALVRSPGRDFNDGWLCSPWTQANVFAAWVINRRNIGEVRE